MTKFTSFIKNNVTTIFDLALVLVAYGLGIIIYFDFSLTQQDFYGNNAPYYFHQLTQQSWVILIVYLIVFKILNLDKTVRGMASVYEATRIIIAAITGTLLFLFIAQSVVRTHFPLGMYTITTLFLIMALEFTRFYKRMAPLVSIHKNPIQDDKIPTLIVGAGAAGYLLYKEVTTNHIYNDNIVGFIDDDLSKSGKNIGGVKVLGTSAELTELVKKFGVKQVYVAMPSVALPIQRTIIEQAVSTGCKVKAISSTQDMFSSSGIKKNLHAIDIEDLLGRNAITLDNSALRDFIEGQVILITGAAGSIGSELARQVYAYKPKTLLLIDINENGLYDLHQNFMMERKAHHPTQLVALIINMCERNDLIRLFDKYHPSIVIHAAAHKHVPLMEDMPAEAIRNNIFGSVNLIEVAKAHQVKRFLTISTDKAVNPTNVMGATKRFIEQIIQSIDHKTCETKFMAVRFGNVLGSNGSIIPLFKRQIEAGGPLTLTHKDIIRYFMTIPEAVSLVLQAAVYAQGGEIFVLDMGKPVKILDLAKNLIRLAGYEPYVDIDIKEVGLRKGEKLFEELHLSKEEVSSTPNQLIFVTHPIAIDPETIRQDLELLKNALDEDDAVIIETLRKTVPTYIPNRS